MNISSERIKMRRKELGLNQDDLAQMIGKTQTQVSRYENGDYAPDGDALIDLSRALGVSTDWLLGLDDREMEVLTGEEREVVTVFRSKEPKRRQAIVEIMRLAQ